MFPTHPEALNEAWLTTALHESGLLTRGRVLAAQLEMLRGAKGVMGLIARLSLDYDRAEQTAPHTLIAKFSASDLAIRSLGNALGLYKREVHFYRELAERVAVQTPRCYFAAIDPVSGESLLLLEDLAPARNGDRIAGCEPHEATLVIDALATMHADWWMRPALADLDWLRPFDTAPLQDAYQRAWGPFTAKLGDSLSPNLRSIGERFRASLTEVFAAYWAEPWTLIHNDLQLDNLFFGRNESHPSLCIIDWQSVLRGRGMLEVAGFLGGNLSIENRRAHEMALLNTYHTTLVTRGIRGYSFEQCYNDNRISMFDGFSRMVIALASNLHEAQERAHREVLWPRYSTAIVDLRAGEMLPR